MTATKQFIEDAIEGGWCGGFKLFVVGDGFFLKQGDKIRESINVYRTLLDPTIWKAVGKTRGWRDADPMYGKEYGTVTMEFKETVSDWSSAMDHFIDHLVDGKTVEDSLQAISK